MEDKFIVFARRSANDGWMRVRTTPATTKAVSLKVAKAKGRQWLKAGWMVQIMNINTQEAQELQ